MVQLTNKSRVRRTVRHRDFAPVSHRAPVVTKKLSRAYYHKEVPKWRYWLWLSVAVFFLGLMVALVYSPLFTIKNIVINNIEFRPTEDRLREILNQALTKKKWYLLPQSNLILFNTGDTQKILATEFYIEEVTFSRHWPNVLKVNVANNVIVAIWQTDNGEFLMDRRGLLVQQSADVSADTSSLPIVKEQPGNNRVLGDTVVTSQIAEYIDSLYEQWKKNLPSLLPEKIVIDSGALPTIQVLMPGGWYVNISAESEVEPQLSSLKRLIEERVKEDISKLQYIDVRFGNRLYFKLK